MNLDFPNLDLSRRRPFVSFYETAAELRQGNFTPQYHNQPYPMPGVCPGSCLSTGKFFNCGTEFRLMRHDKFWRLLLSQSVPGLATRIASTTELRDSIRLLPDGQPGLDVFEHKALDLVHQALTQELRHYQNLDLFQPEGVAGLGEMRKYFPKVNCYELFMQTSLASKLSAGFPYREEGLLEWFYTCRSAESYPTKTTKDIAQLLAAEYEIQARALRPLAHGQLALDEGTPFALAHYLHMRFMQWNFLEYMGKPVAKKESSIRDGLLKAGQEFDEFVTLYLKWEAEICQSLAAQADLAPQVKPYNSRGVVYFIKKTGTQTECEIGLCWLAVGKIYAAVLGEHILRLRRHEGPERMSVPDLMRLQKWEPAQVLKEGMRIVPLLSKPMQEFFFEQVEGWHPGGRLTLEIEAGMRPRP